MRISQRPAVISFALALVLSMTLHVTALAADFTVGKLNLLSASVLAFKGSLPNPSIWYISRIVQSESALRRNCEGNEQMSANPCKHRRLSLCPTVTVSKSVLSETADLHVLKHVS